MIYGPCGMEGVIMLSAGVTMHTSQLVMSA